MLTENSVILTLVEAIGLALSIAIIAKSLFKIQPLLKFLLYSSLLITFYVICIFIYPPACALAAMLILTVLSYRDSKNYLYSYYLSTMCIAFFAFINGICTIGFQFIIPNRKLILAVPLFLYIQIIIISILISISLKKVDLSLKSILNMKIQSLINTVFLMFYFIIMPQIYSYNDDFSTALYSLMLVSFILNIIMTFVVKNNETKVLIAETNNKYLDYTKQTAIKQYREAIMFKHNYAYRFHALAYYIQKKDMEGLNKYFDEYIMPIQNANYSNDQILATLGNLNEGIIRNSIFMLYTQCCSYGICLSLQVFLESEDIPANISNIDLVTILGIFCEIAFHQANTSKESSISAIVDEEENITRISLENVFRDKKTGQDIDGQFHDEIQIIDELRDKYKNINIHFIQQKDRYIQKLLIAKEKVS